MLHQLQTEITQSFVLRSISWLCNSTVEHELIFCISIIFELLQWVIKSDAFERELESVHHSRNAVNN